MNCQELSVFLILFTQMIYFQRENTLNYVKGNNSLNLMPTVTFKPGIHDASFASKSPFKFLEFKFFDRVYHTRNLNQKT